MEPKKEKSLSEFLTSEPLMKKMIITQLLLFLSIFSFVFSYCSLCSSSLFHPQKLPENPFYLHSHAVNKNYIFLICNALLVFLSKTSGFVRSSSGFDLNDMLQKRVGDGLMLTKEPAFLQRLEEDEEDHQRILSEERILDQTSTGSMVPERESENRLLDDDIIQEDESMEEQDVAEEEALSTEELNKKFEEFIKKTKEEIMMNETRQLVIVK